MFLIIKEVQPEGSRMGFETKKKKTSPVNTKEEGDYNLTQTLSFW